jgi:ComEC/Rec2-related protein
MQRDKARIRRTTAWLLFTSACVVGVGVSHRGFVIPWRLLSSVVLVGLFSWRRQSRVLIGIVVIVLGFGFGLSRGHNYLQKVQRYDELYLHHVTLRVNALNDGIYAKKQQLVFDASGVECEGKQLVGKIAVSGFGEPAILAGDTVLVSGKLYPSRGSYQARMSYAILVVVAHHESIIGRVRRNFVAGMQSALPEPLGSFALGLLIGQRATLPDEVKQDLLIVGLTHIIAVSGYNMTIMLRASKNIFGRRSKRLSTGLALGLVVIFLLLTGSSASIVRAAIISMLSIFATYYGRSFRPLNLIMIAAAITAWLNPAYVWSDIGWYLSFLAFYGVLVVAPLVAQRLPGRLKKSIIVMMIIESLSAEIMTLPIILYIFGQVSFVALAANIIIAALVPLAMVLSLVAGLAGMFVASVSGWVAWPGRIVLTYMLDAAHSMATVPHVFAQGLGFSLTQMIFTYSLIASTTCLLWFKAHAKSATLTDRAQIFT